MSDQPNWQWCLHTHDELRELKVSCARCHCRLNFAITGEMVHYLGSHWHLDCLLSHLTSPATAGFHP